MQPLDGVVLAGGRSRRLGQDKALLRFDGEPLLSIVVGRVAQVCDRVVVATDRPGRHDELALPARFVADITPGHGALSGLQSGLRASETQHVMVAACDLPFLNVELLRHMAGLPRSYQALVPWLDDRWHPLHAVYARSCLAAVDGLLAAGGGSLRALLAQLDVRRLDVAEVRRFDPQGLSLMNLNRPADVVRARAIWQDLRAKEIAGG